MALKVEERAEGFGGAATVGEFGEADIAAAGGDGNGAVSGSEIEADSDFFDGTAHEAFLQNLYILLTTGAASPPSMEQERENRLRNRSFWLLAFSLTSSALFADTVYNEAVSGDLSNSGLTPNVLAFAPGSNQVIGTTGRGAATDRDYFTITVPTGYQISRIVELAGTQAGGVSFFAIQAGPQVTIPTSATTAAGLLGWTHYESAAVNTDILPAISLPAEGSSGFSALTASQYSFWIQDFTAGSYNYAFDIQLAQTPEPATYATALTALIVVGLVARKRRKIKLF